MFNITWKRLFVICICISLSSFVVSADDNDYNDYYDYDDDTSASAADSLKSGPPPFFEIDHLKVEAQVGDNVMFNCDVRNFDAQNIINWYNGSVPLSAGNVTLTNRIKTFRNNSIQVQNVQEWDAGDYYCSVLPEQIKLQVDLKIFPRLAIYHNGHSVTGQSLTLRKGSPLKIDCRINIKDGVLPQLKWSINGRRAELLNAKIMDSRLIIDHVDTEHAGIYQCLADDGSSNLQHVAITVDVQHIQVSTHRHHVNTAADAKTELYCDYYANPTADVHWIRNGRVLGLSEKYLISNMPHHNRNRSILRIKDVNADDLGEYVCQVQNSLESETVHIFVGYEPETPQFENMQIFGRRVILDWLVRSIQPLSEAVLDYKMTGVFSWSTVSVLRTQKHAKGDNFWKVSHEIELMPGEWHTRVKTQNTGGWSRFSPPHIFVIKADDEDDMLETDQIVVAAGIGGSKLGNSSSYSHHTTNNLWATSFCVLLTVFLIQFQSIV